MYIQYEGDLKSLSGGKTLKKAQEQTVTTTHSFSDDGRDLTEMLDHVSEEDHIVGGETHVGGSHVHQNLHLLVGVLLYIQDITNVGDTYASV